MVNEELLKERIQSQDLTDQQAAAIFADEKEYLLRAAPGSGKTWTSCRRFIWRGANWEYEVGGLALLSFTNTAINEFYEATKNIGKRELLNDPNYVGTFDSFIERFIISPFGHKFSNKIKRPKLFLSPLPSHHGNDKLNAWYNGSKKSFPVKAWDIIPQPLKGQLVYKAKNTGNKRLSFSGNDPLEEFFKLGYYTHSHRPYLAFKILTQYEKITKNLSKRFPEIIVDEAQDTNVWLLHILNLLHEAGTKVTLIGDPDQCIYEFSLADPDSLFILKDHWNLTAKPLSKSFRCNNDIALAVKNIGTNLDLIGSGSESNEYRSAFIFKVTNPNYKGCINAYKKLLKAAEVEELSSSILARGHSQLEDINGVSNYKSFKGKTKKLAQASSRRDNLNDYSKAYEIVEKVIRKISDQPEYWEYIDDNPDSPEARKLKFELWKFVKSENGLPALSLNGNDWIEAAKDNLEKLFQQLGFSDYPSLGYKIKRTGLGDGQRKLPLLEPKRKSNIDDFQLETIHQSKGKSRDGVLLLGSSKFFNSVVKAIKNDKNIEPRRLAYVGMTRARYTLLVGLPQNHFDDYSSDWIEWGFKVLTND